jgi:dienelactone hydrolase
MGKIRWSLSSLLGVGVFLMIVPLAPALAGGDPPPFSPGWYAREAQNYADAHGRTADQLSNVAYHQLRLEVCSSGTSDGGACNGDPFRRLEAWNGARGQVVEVGYPNRYGATIRADLWAPTVPFTDPVSGTVSSGPFPGVILVSGYGFERHRYRAFAQGLAESGYVVLTFDPQGQGDSDVAPNPTSTYCDPNGAWRQPQEMGISETGTCAGEDPQPEATTQDLPYLPPILLFQDAQGVQPLYDAIRPRFVFGTLDAAAWLLSDANPLRGIVDETRLGVAGHSIGAYAAMMVANGDPLHRFRTGISWDSFAYMDNGVAPTVPTSFQQSEQENLIGPRHAPPPDREALHPARLSYHAFVSSCVDTKFIVLRSSTHREWSYFAPGLVSEASSKGERAALYESLAWLDRYLKGAVTNRARGDEATQATDGLRRLDAATFDGSVDRSSIGAGRWDQASGSNAPYTLEGDLVADHLSDYYDSDATVQRCLSP